MTDAIVSLSQTILIWYALNAGLFFVFLIADPKTVEEVRDMPEAQGLHGLLFLAMIHVLIPFLCVVVVIFLKRLICGKPVQDG